MLPNLPPKRLPLVLFAATTLLFGVRAAHAGGPLTAITNIQDQSANCSITITYSWESWHNADSATITLSDDDGDVNASSTPAGEAGNVSVTLSLSPALTTHAFSAEAHLIRNGKPIAKSSLTQVGSFQCT